ncbi:hypothetical protein JCM8097_001885 [Rhodosporidiobolus ruineniae]
MHPFLPALVVRLLSALLARAFFQPDEYWQNLEVAHRWVWGYSRQTWEWTVAPGEGWWDAETLRTLLREGGRGGIRSPLGVVPTAAVYQLLKLLGWEDGGVLVLAPRLLQAVFAASTDVAVHRLASRVLGPRYANAALFASLTSFFHFFTLSRTFSNSTETALTAWALVYWPFPSPPSSAPAEEDDEANKGHPAAAPSEEKSSLALALTFAAAATIMRPSNAVIWIVLGAQLFWREKTGSGRWKIVRTAASISLLASLLTLALDSLFYHTPTFTPLRFLHLNVLRSISLFYGANAFHFYLSQGIPLLLLTQLPFFLDGLRPALSGRARNPLAVRSLLGTAAATTAAYSLLSHKEWRFLHPLLPVLHLPVALSLSGRASSSSAPTSSSARRWGVKKGDATLLLLGLVPAVYLSAFHGIGQNAVMHHLRSVLQSSAAGGAAWAGEGTSVGFLVPCHSVGWQAFLHAPGLEEEGRAWDLTCEPPILGQDPSLYLDHSDHFYASPSLYLTSRFPRTVDASFPPSPPPAPPPGRAEEAYDLHWRHTWPERLVLFSNLLAVSCTPSSAACGREGTVGGLLEGKGYEEERRFWNTLGGWHEDERRRGEVVVLRWAGSQGLRGERKE